MFGVQQVNHTLENCAQSLWGAIPRGALVEPVKGGYVVRSCALFSFYANYISRQRSDADMP